MITDDQLKGADTLVTARVLAAAIKRLDYDLVIAGVESTDGYTGTLPMAVAELLGVPSATFARADTSRTGEEVAMRDFTSGDCPTQRIGYVRLDGDVSEALWSVFAGECERHCAAGVPQA